MYCGSQISLHPVSFHDNQFRHTRLFFVPRFCPMPRSPEASSFQRRCQDQPYALARCGLLRLRMSFPNLVINLESWKQLTASLLLKLPYSSDHVRCHRDANRRSDQHALENIPRGFSAAPPRVVTLPADHKHADRRKCNAVPKPRHADWQ